MECCFVPTLFDSYMCKYSGRALAMCMPNIIVSLDACMQNVSMNFWQYVIKLALRP